MITLTVKKITLINHKVGLIKESLVFLSGRLSGLNHILADFKIEPDNPISVSAELMTSDYKALAESVGNLVKSIKQAEDEVLVSDDN
jgi:hypothetical protein